MDYTIFHVILFYRCQQFIAELRNVHLFYLHFLFHLRKYSLNKCHLNARKKLWNYVKTFEANNGGLLLDTE